MTYEVRFSSAAARQFKKLTSADRDHVRKALLKAALTLAKPGAREGQALKKIKGRHDSVYRLRVGDLRAMFDLIPEDGVLLVLGVVDRRDLERWLRTS